MKKLRQEFSLEHGLDMFLVPTRGYLDLQDKRLLNNLGFRFRLTFDCCTLKSGSYLTGKDPATVMAISKLDAGPAGWAKT